MSFFGKLTIIATPDYKIAVGNTVYTESVTFICYRKAEADVAKDLAPILRDVTSLNSNMLNQAIKDAVYAIAFMAAQARFCPDRDFEPYEERWGTTSLYIELVIEKIETEGIQIYI